MVVLNYSWKLGNPPFLVEEVDQGGLPVSHWESPYVRAWWEAAGSLETWHRVSYVSLQPRDVSGEAENNYLLWASSVCSLKHWDSNAD